MLNCSRSAFPRLPLFIVCMLSSLLDAATESAPAREWVSYTDGPAPASFTTEGNWMRKDGVISLVPRPGEEGWKRFASYLWLDGEYQDFVCEFDYKLEDDGNSGFYFRVADVGDPVRTGLEVQLTEVHGKERVGWHDLGGIIRFTSPERGTPLANASNPAGEWNRVKVQLSANRLTVVINGVVVQQELDLSAHPVAGAGLAPRGRIGFQDHGLPVQLRNLRIRPLD